MLRDTGSRDSEAVVPFYYHISEVTEVIRISTFEKKNGISVPLEIVLFQLAF